MRSTNLNPTTSFNPQKWFGRFVFRLSYIAPMSAVEEDKTMDADEGGQVAPETAEFCARELAKAKKMQISAAKDKGKTSVLLAELTVQESALCQARKVEVEAQANEKDSDVVTEVTSLNIE